MTRHQQRRIAQREITKDMVSLACVFGDCRQDRDVLGRDRLDALIPELALLSSLAKRVRDKGSVVVVEKEGTQLTTYNADSYRWSRS